MYHIAPNAEEKTQITLDTCISWIVAHGEIYKAMTLLLSYAMAKADAQDKELRDARATIKAIGKLNHDNQAIAALVEGL